MRYGLHVLAVPVAVVLVAVGAAASGMAFSRTTTSSIDPGFHPDTGQINSGTAPRVASAAPAPPAPPTQQQARVALMMPDSGLTSLGEAPAPTEASAGQGGSASATTGAAPPSGTATPPPGPIGATLQTMPAKFSQRNDVLDRVRIMAWPFGLSEQRRQQIYQAVMATKSQPAAGADEMKPADELSADQAAYGMHTLPAGIDNIAGLAGYSYVKGHKKVLLIEPSTRTVIDEINS